MTREELINLIYSLDKFKKWQEVTGETREAIERIIKFSEITIEERETGKK